MMTRVCLLGGDEVNLQYELLSRETAREALAAYDLQEPFDNSVAADTVSLGAAVALLNDLEWYLVRFVEAAFVHEPSVDEEEWLSRDLAAAIRNDAVDPEDSGRFLAVYGVEYPGGDGPTESSGTSDGEGLPGETSEAPPKLVEPMFVTRTGETIPEYDLRDVDETLLVRVTKSEFGA